MVAAIRSGVGLCPCRPFSSSLHHKGRQRSDKRCSGSSEHPADQQIILFWQINSFLTLKLHFHLPNKCLLSKPEAVSVWWRGKEEDLENSLYMCLSAVCLCFMVRQMFKKAFQQRMTSQRSSCCLSSVWPCSEKTTHHCPSSPHALCNVMVLLFWWEAVLHFQFQSYPSHNFNLE